MHVLVISDGNKLSALIHCINCTNEISTEHSILFILVLINAVTLEKADSYCAVIISVTCCFIEIIISILGVFFNF